MPIGLSVVIAVLVAVVAVGGWTLLTHPTVLRRGLHGLLIVGTWIPVGCPPCRAERSRKIEQSAQRLATRLALLRPGGLRWLGFVALAALSWTLDYLTLTAVVAAVGLPAPWAVLAVGFLVVQASIALQILPGGAGLAETGLLGVLVTAGLAAAPAAASVLVYRAISWLGLSMLGWIIYGVRIHTNPVKLHRHTPEAKAAEVRGAATLGWSTPD
jgi:hypothetical protein